MGAEEKLFATIKDVYRELWAGREFELTHLWQRSVFLGAFMLAIAAGYGHVASKIIFPELENYIILKTENKTEWQLENINVISQSETRPHQHLAAVALCYLGLAFSMLWVMMAKGSKYWSERYEASITKMYEEDCYGSRLKNSDPYYSNLVKLKDSEISDNLFSPLAGRYSVSRVNVSIGIIGIISWNILNMIHAGMWFKTVFSKMSFTQIQYALFGIGQCLIISVLIFLILNILCRTKG